jgi:hypothetical protein
MVTVTYHCPRCGAVAALDRDAYLSDKCVTPEPLDGWEYLAAYDLDGEADPQELADGVELVCGAAETDGEGCGEPYYLSFVRFEAGTEVDPDRPTAVDADFDFLRR